MKKIILTTLLVLGIVGCKTTEPLYYYGEYNSAVYSYFKSEDVSLEAQITVLQQAIEQAAAQDKDIAPGIHAHLGMLYFESGNGDRGTLHFEQEKALFPESAQYIDFLLNAANATGA
ncbi:DUF4810 domain-containing protein [Alteromonas stellipolaris]|jgi:hypothetical protein|uniref:DUF4810 domain-containing protein n=1 Tax=Alteromonas stellipolaris TaxID=233316 RepID=UPI002735494F|nr:DUF4810 domain-containing protein [Alteromonas stellipolaris]MDP2537641.1 DUF4810 domain-containing protein [Alteromonas stellipolaris]